MRVSETRKVTIVGAGMSGALLAILLARKGFEVELFEAHPDPRGDRPRRHQTVDLALGERARFALQQAGLLAEVDALCTRVNGRMIHDRSGGRRMQPYGVSDADALYSIRRDRLRRCLLDAAEAAGRVRIAFEQRLRNIDWDRSEIVLARDEGDEFRHPFEVLIGADGPRSATRRALQEVAPVAPEENLLDSGYKAFSIPAGEDGGFRMEPDVLHVWPRGGYMLIAFPDVEGSFSALLFLPRSGDHRMMWGFEQLDSWTRQRAFMEFNFPDAVPLIPDLERDFRDNPVGFMSTVKCGQWHHGGQALLIGDAAHNIVPFHGQGVNAAFEDCTTLMAILEEQPAEWADVFAELQRRRKADTDALAEMSLDAYQTMRESVRHRDFMLRKALERELERHFPDRFVARYSLVMFHRTPYAEAFRRGKTQAAILDELLDGRTALPQVDLRQAERLIAERLEPI
ncbi:MAG: FAD-dependent monooxygenase [Xanthomonadales bacterium]|nr:FAD-dependent monooxygenase [Xanthomonadales bacterium]